MSKSFSRNTFWFTGVTVVERIAAVLQTVLLARILGITDYGIFGLLFGTIGLVASIAGLQLGLTATVFVSKYRDNEKEKAAFVISFTKKFGYIISITFLILVIPFSRILSYWLIGVSGYEMPVIAGGIMIALSIVSGMQDGIIQGFEDFRILGIVKLAVTVFTLVSLYPIGRLFGLFGVMVAILLSGVIKYALLSQTIKSHIQAYQIPSKGGGLKARDFILGFSFPSVLVSLLVGSITWAGNLVISRQSMGFESLAIVSTGQQWRGPILLLASITSTVLLPLLSRNTRIEEQDTVNHSFRQVFYFISAISIGASIVMTMASSLILRTYGSRFLSGTTIFSLLVISAIPNSLATIYMQRLIADSQMWKILYMHVAWAVIQIIGYITLLPIYGGKGIGITNIVSWTVLFIISVIVCKKHFNPLRHSKYGEDTLLT